MLEMVKERLKSFGYELKERDEFALAFSIQKVENVIKNDCGTLSVPDGLVNIAVDMAVGEFLTAKKTFSPDNIAGLDLDMAVSRYKRATRTLYLQSGKEV